MRKNSHQSERCSCRACSALWETSPDVDIKVRRPFPLMDAERTIRIKPRRSPFGTSFAPTFKRIFLTGALVLLCTGTLSASDRLSLDEALRIALQNNRQIHWAEQNVIAAKARKEQSFTSFLPRLSSSSTITHLDKKTEMMGLTMTDKRLYDLNLNISQPLFAGGRLISLYRQAKEGVIVAEEESRQTKINLISDVKCGYYNVLKSEKLVGVSKEAVNQIEEHLKMVKNLYNVGMAPRVDVLKTEVQLAHIKQDLIEAENMLALSKSSFNNLLNRDLDAPVELIDIITYQKKEISLKNSIQKALQQRPESKIQEANLKVASEGIKIAKSGYFPSVSLVTNYDREKGSRIPVNEWDESWNAVLVFDIDIWNWKRTSQKVKESGAILSQTEDLLSLLKDSIQLEVKSAFLNLKSAEKKIKVTEIAVSQAEENFRMTELRFKEGMATNTDVLDSQTFLSQARTDYYSSLYGYLEAEANLRQSMGEM